MSLDPLSVHSRGLQRKTPIKHHRLGSAHSHKSRSVVHEDKTLLLPDAKLPEPLTLWGDDEDVTWSYTHG